MAEQEKKTLTATLETVVSEENDFKITTFNVSEIKNKQRRQNIYRRLKAAQQKEKKFLREEKKREYEELGDKAPPKSVPRTIENTREADVTMVTPDDQEVLRDEGLDEMSSYFNRQTTPKIFMTSSYQPHTRTLQFCHELEAIFPNSKFYKRPNCPVKKILPLAVNRGFSDVLIINEDRCIPSGVLFIHLPEGPSAYFRVSNVRFSKTLKHGKEKTKHYPEIILNNFNTRLGHTIGRMLATLFPHDPQFHGRRVVTFHNQRDYIFFRHHRYMFKNGKKVALVELGPRFTLKLRHLQKGLFDPQFGEYEWVLKRHEMETSRRRFFL